MITTIIKTYSESWVTVEEAKKTLWTLLLPSPHHAGGHTLPMISFWQHCQNTLLLCHHGGLEVSMIVKLNSLIAVVSPSNLELSKREQSASCSFLISCTSIDIPGGTVVKNPPVNAGDAGDKGLIPGLGRCPGGENGNPLQYFRSMENSMDRGAWRATVRGLQTVGHDLSMHAPAPMHLWAWVLVSHFINVAWSWSPSICKRMKMTSCKQELPFPGRGIKTTQWLFRRCGCPFSLEQQVVDPHGLLVLVALSTEESQKRDGGGWG